MLKTEKKASKKQLVEHLNILSGDKNFTAYKIKLWQEKTNAFFFFVGSFFFTSSGFRVLLFVI